MQRTKSRFASYNNYYWEDYILAFIVMRSVTETCNFAGGGFDFEHDNTFYIKD